MSAIGGAAALARLWQWSYNRYGCPEETRFTIAYSPVPDKTVPSGIGGVLATVHEITGKVLGERRVAVLRDPVSLILLLPRSIISDGPFSPPSAPILHD